MEELKQDNESLVAEIGRLNEEIASLKTNLENSIEENRDLIKILRQVDGLIWDARNLTKDY